LELRVVDKVIPEKTPTTVKNMDDVSAIMKAELLNWLERMEGVEVDALLEQRYRRYRERGHESAFMATIESHTLCDTFVSESLSYTQ